MSSRPPSGMASRALTARFIITCSIWLASARMAPRSGEDNKLDVFADQPGNQLPHLLDDVVKAHHAGLQHLHAAEGEKLPGERRGAIGGAIDQFDFSRR